MYEKKKCKTLILDFIPLLLISIIISSILFSLASLSSFESTLNYSNYNAALAFPPANQTQTNNNNTSSGFTIDADKIVYVGGEYVVVDGKVDKVIEGKNVRLDFYGPDDEPISLSLFIEPNENGFFSYSGLNSVYIPADSKPGEYTLLATYNKKSVETKIMVK